MLDPVYIDLENYERLDHFNYFRSLAYPYVGVTVNVTITDFLSWTKENQYPFFLSFLWCVSQAANAVPELRQRIREDKIIEYPFCHTSHTVAKDNNTFAYCILDCQKGFSQFIIEGKIQQEKIKQSGTIEEDAAVSESLFFISSLPWLSYTSLIQPVPMPSDSNPRITWGKFFDAGPSKQIPVTLLCHHGLVDGKHLGDFYAALDKIIADLILGST